MRLRTLNLIAASLLLALSASQATAQAKRKPAQDPPRFSPPRPPSLDQDFEDPGEDELENGDAPSRAQAPPPPGSGTPPPPAYSPPPPSMSGSGGPGGPGNTNGAKLKFRLADGEYYAKGKKRGRTPPNQRDIQSVRSSK